MHVVYPYIPSLLLMVQMGTTAGRVVSPHSIMVQNGFSSKEVRRASKQNINYAKQQHTLHCWLPAKVMRPANSTKHFSWLTHSTPNFIVEEHSNIYIYIYIYTLIKE